MKYASNNDTETKQWKQSDAKSYDDDGAVRLWTDHQKQSEVVVRSDN